MKLRKILAVFDYNPYCQKQITIASEGGLNIFNSYRPPEWKREWFLHGNSIEFGRVPEIYDEFFAHLTNGDIPSKEYLMDWLANSLRTRNQTVLTAIGKQGIGKGVLGHIMEQLHGETNFSNVRDDVFKNRFNSRLADRTLVYVDEADLKTKESQDRFKVVVNKKIEVEEKGVDARTAVNHASFYLTSNSFDAIRVEADDRRFSIIELTDVPLKETPWIGRIGELLSQVNINALAVGLWHREIKNNMLTPFKAMRALDVMEAGLADWESYVVFEWCPLNAGRTFQLRELQDAIKDNCGFRTSPGRRKIQELAEKYPAALRVVQDRHNRAARVVEALGTSAERKAVAAGCYIVK